MTSIIGPVAGVVLGELLVLGIILGIMQTPFGTNLKADAAWLVSQSAIHPLLFGTVILFIGLLLVDATRRVDRE